MPDPKTDAVLNRSPIAGEALFDFQIGADGDIITEDQLDTAILVSLFTDRRAEAHDVAKPQLRRGWVGDLETPDDLWGTTLWLLEQARLTNDTAALAKDAMKVGLEWFVRDSIAIDVSTRAFIDGSDMKLQADITKPSAKTESFVVSLWENTGRS